MSYHDITYSIYQHHDVQSHNIGNDVLAVIEHQNVLRTYIHKIQLNHMYQSIIHY